MPGPESVAAKPRFFTREEANRALPLVRAIVGDIVQQFEAVHAAKQRLIDRKNRGRRPSGENAVPTEAIERVEADLEAAEAQLITFVEELTRLGVELKGPDGLCDFPSLRDGREVYLCWRLGEPSVQFWHEISAGVAGRQPL